MDRRTFIGSTAASAVLAVPAKAETPNRVGLVFTQDGAPEVPKGSHRTFIIMARHREGKEYVTPAYYLNAFPLEYDDCICGSEDDHEDGCPTTGWFYDESNFEYQNCYWAIEGKVLAWAPIPSAEDVKAILPDDTLSF